VTTTTNTTTELRCPECNSPRPDLSRVCEACGAPPAGSELRATDPLEGVRAADIEPYIALRYIARLFKILAVLILLMLAGEVVLGLLIDGRAALTTLLGEATRLLVLAGMLWAAGDIAVLMIDAGHDLRVTRILLGRINARLQENVSLADREPARAEPASAAPARRVP
jgi:hypothetical protein